MIVEWLSMYAYYILTVFALILLVASTVLVFLWPCSHGSVLLICVLAVHVLVRMSWLCFSLATRFFAPEWGGGAVAMQVWSIANMVLDLASLVLLTIFVVVMGNELRKLREEAAGEPEELPPERPDVPE